MVSNTRHIYCLQTNGEEQREKCKLNKHTRDTIAMTNAMDTKWDVLNDLNWKGRLHLTLL